jgi:hypothetical protein
MVFVLALPAQKLLLCAKKLQRIKRFLSWQSQSKTVIKIIFIKNGQNLNNDDSRYHPGKDLGFAQVFASGFARIKARIMICSII